MTTPAVSSTVPSILASLAIPLGETTAYQVPSARGVKVATASLCNTSNTSTTVTDAVTVNGNTAVTSAAANWSSALHQGMSVAGTGVPTGTTIASVPNAHTIVLSAPATADGTGISLTYRWPAQSVNVGLQLVPSGGLASYQHRLISSFALASGDALSLNEYLAGAMLGEGDVVGVYASVGSIISFLLTGLVMS